MADVLNVISRGRRPYSPRDLRGLARQEHRRAVALQICKEPPAVAGGRPGWETRGSRNAAVRSAASRSTCSTAWLYRSPVIETELCPRRFDMASKRTPPASPVVAAPCLSQQQSRP